MISNKYLPVLVSGFGAAVLSTVPGIKNFSCCLIVPGAAAIAVLLDKKNTNTLGRVSMGKGILSGLLTGFVATFFITIFEILLTYFAKSNDFVESIPQSEMVIRQWNLGPIVNESLKMMKSVAKEITRTGFSFLYLIMILSSNFLVNSIFGMVGGALGVNLANRKSNEGNKEE